MPTSEPPYKPPPSNMVSWLLVILIIIISSLIISILWGTAYFALVSITNKVDVKILTPLLSIPIMFVCFLFGPLLNLIEALLRYELARWASTDTLSNIKELAQVSLVRRNEGGATVLMQILSEFIHRQKK